MGLVFKPNGLLDIATEATDLPSQATETGVYSEALARCKNLRIDRKGILRTRDGSSKINETAFESNTELLTNGTFASDLTGWTDQSLGGSLSWNSGAMRFESSGGAAIAQQAVSITSQNVSHTLEFDVTNASTQEFTVIVGTTPGGSDLYGPVIFSATSSNSVSFTPTAATVYLRFIKSAAGSAATVDVDNVSIKLSVEPVNLIVEQAGVRFEFSGPQIFRNESSIASSLTDAQWSAIKYNAFNDTTQQIYALNGTDRKRIESSTVYEWGIAAPGSAPTVAVGSGTGLTGSYKAKITYCRKVGSVVVSESNPSSASGSQSLANQALRVTWIASTDSQVTHVRVYRTLAGGDLYYHDQDVAIGVTTVDTTTADASLGDEVETDHDRPPLGQFVSGPAYDGTCFIVKNNLLHYCKPKQPEYWPSDYYVEVSTVQAPGECPVVFHNSQPFFLTAVEIYQIQGTGHGTFLPIPMNAKTGAQGPFGALAVKGKGIFHTGPDGIYLFAGEDVKISEPRFDPIFRGEETNGMPGVSSMTTAIFHRFGNNLYFGYTSTGHDYPTNFIVINLDTNRASYYTYDDGSPIEIRCMATDETNTRLLAGDSSGFIRKLEDTSVTTDSGEAIDWEVQSKDYTLQTRRHFPRYAKYDVDASDAASCTGEIILDGTSIQSHTITGDRIVRYRHIDTNNGKRCAVRISGSGPASVYAAEME